MFQVEHNATADSNSQTKCKIYQLFSVKLITRRNFTNFLSHLNIQTLPNNDKLGWVKNNFVIMEILPLVKQVWE